MLTKLDAAMLVRDALDESLMLEGVETVDGGFVGGDLAAELDFPDKRSAAVFVEIPPDKLEHRLLFLGQGESCQRGLPR